jgi:MFS family permease
MPSLVAYVLDRESSSPGSAMGIFTAISDLGLSLGPVIMGMMIHMSAYPVMFLCFFGLYGVINVIYFYFFVAEKRKAINGHGARNKDRKLFKHLRACCQEESLIS